LEFYSVILNHIYNIKEKLAKVKHIVKKLCVVSI
jgi:hypothetical protein